MLRNKTQCMKVDSVLLLQKSGTFLALSLNLDFHRPSVCGAGPNPAGSASDVSLSIQEGPFPGQGTPRAEAILQGVPASSTDFTCPFPSPGIGVGNDPPKRAIFKEANRGLQPCLSTFTRNRQYKGSFSIFCAKDQRLDRRIIHCSAPGGRHFSDPSV